MSEPIRHRGYYIHKVEDRLLVSKGDDLKYGYNAMPNDLTFENITDAKKGIAALKIHITIVRHIGWGHHEIMDQDIFGSLMTLAGLET